MARKSSDRKLCVVSVPLPKCRDPFVNAPLLSLGKDESGVESFWITSRNSNMGCIATTVKETGEYRIYRFNKPKHPGFYSVIRENQDTLWLCTDLSYLVRFSLSTGKYESFLTGAPKALVFPGMVFDQATGKLFVIAHPKVTHAVGYSFDVKTRRTVKLFEEFSNDCYIQCSFPNSDGTYSIILYSPGESLIQWDPVRDTVQTHKLREKIDLHVEGKIGSMNRVICSENGNGYFPHRGWYDVKSRIFSQDANKPESERNSNDHHTQHLSAG